jgi:hypothetical protein
MLLCIQGWTNDKTGFLKVTAQIKAATKYSKNSKQSRRPKKSAANE